MTELMSKKLRAELLESLRPKYVAMDWKGKKGILDAFVAATGYDRKYAIVLLNKLGVVSSSQQQRAHPPKYDEQVRQALVTVWYAANQICSKRLVPFLPELVESLERHGHIKLPEEVRSRLLKISPATVDRLLRTEKAQTAKNPSTTRPGNLLKHQIKVRTFSDWNDIVPGFVEADTLAHCGGDMSGQFLRTMVLIDISTGWIELLPLLRGSSQDVLTGIKVATDLLPFQLLGFDTDNGSEFINHDVIEYCDENKITFTRSRAYRKNDQAHVEERNLSVVRRIVGYDRYEGKAAWLALSKLYRLLRQYVNFFQPSMKLSAKHRQGTKVTRSYNPAKTPYQRILLADSISQRIKDELREQYLALDPANMLNRLEQAQSELFAHAWKTEVTIEDKKISKGTAERIASCEVPTENLENQNSLSKLKRFNNAGKPDNRRGPRTYRTRPDALIRVWPEMRLKLELHPDQTAKSLFQALVTKYPGEYNAGQLRTLQRRVAQWRQEQQGYETQMRENLTPANRPTPLIFSSRGGVSGSA